MRVEYIWLFAPLVALWLFEYATSTERTKAEASKRSGRQPQCGRWQQRCDIYVAVASGVWHVACGTSSFKLWQRHKFMDFSSARKVNALTRELKTTECSQTTNNNDNHNNSSNKQQLHSCWMHTVPHTPARIFVCIHPVSCMFLIALRQPGLAGGCCPLASCGLKPRSNKGLKSTTLCRGFCMYIWADRTVH